MQGLKCMNKTKQQPWANCSFQVSAAYELYTILPTMVRGLEYLQFQVPTHNFSFSYFLIFSPKFSNLYVFYQNIC